jgi:transcriptional regulator with XRE-family HTH domain
MPHVPSSEIRGLFARARLALGFTQKEIADLLGVSMRTASRWEGGDSSPDLVQITKVARAVHPKDAALAEALAAEAGTTLEALGLVVRPKAPPPAPAPVPASRAFPPIALVMDSVLLAAFDAAAKHTDSALRERPVVLDVLRAAVSRARALGLTLEEVDGVFNGAPAPAPPKAGSSRK